MSAKKIVLINQATGYLFRGVANAFSKIYDEVILVTGSEKDHKELNKNVSLHLFISDLIHRLFFGSERVRV